MSEALAEAARSVEDIERRVGGSAVEWSRDWRTSFDDELLERVESYLAAPAPSLSGAPAF